MTLNNYYKNGPAVDSDDQVRGAFVVGPPTTTTQKPLAQWEDLRTLLQEKADEQKCNKADIKSRTIELLLHKLVK